MKKRLIVGIVAVLGIAAISFAGVYALRPELLSKLGIHATTKVDYGLFCNEHGVPEKFCTLCHTERLSGKAD